MNKTILLVLIVTFFVSLESFSSERKNIKIANQYIPELIDINEWASIRSNIRQFSIDASLKEKYLLVGNNIQIGKSIFDYNGLLSKGPVAYEHKTDLYILDLLIPGPPTDEGTLAGYRISFNKKGKITKIVRNIYMK